MWQKNEEWVRNRERDWKSRFSAGWQPQAIVQHCMPIIFRLNLPIETEFYTVFAQTFKLAQLCRKRKFPVTKVNYTVWWLLCKLILVQIAVMDQL